MPYLSDNQSLLTTVVVDNILEGKFGRVLQENSKVSVAMTAELAAGFATVLVGNEVLIDGQELPDTDAFPRNPEDIVAQTVGAVGDEVIIRIRNGNALANRFRSAVFIEPI